jgi:hypothetical protein
MYAVNEKQLADDLASLLEQEERFLDECKGVSTSRMYGERFCQYILMRHLLSKGVAVHAEYSYVDLVVLDPASKAASVHIEMKGPWRINAENQLGGNCGDKLVKDFRTLSGAADSEASLECFSLVTLFGASHKLFGPWLNSFLAGAASAYKGRIAAAWSDALPLNRDEGEMQVLALRISRAVPALQQ